MTANAGLHFSASTALCFDREVKSTLRHPLWWLFAPAEAAAQPGLVKII
jgi:hypothetical protein